MSAFDHLDAALHAPLQCFIEARDHPASELQRVVAFRAAMRIAAPQVALVAFANGGKRGPQAARQAKAEGLVAGFPDMLALHGGRVAFLEWKAGRTMPDQRQIDQLNHLERMGFPVGVFRTAPCAMAWLKEQGFPVEVRP